MSQIIFHKSQTFEAKKCGRPKLRVLILPLAFIGMIGFAINHSIITFTYPMMNFCRPKTNIVFLKTHKCAGSTIQNILMRYGDFHNLTFVLPHEANYLGIGERFKKSFVGPPLLPVYNILAHHTRLDYYEIKKFMPRNAVFITIVRNPVKVFESSYIYYNLHNFYKLHIQQFAHAAPTFNHAFLNQRYQHKIGTNQMLFDLGADSNIFYNKSLVERYVTDLESQFQLVLVSERMDESLILLKNLLCWDVNDVVAFKLNARNPKFKSNLTDNQIRNLEYVNRADMILYERFLHIFERQVKDFGENRMKQELSELRERRNQWFEGCVQKVHMKTIPIKETRSKHKYYYNPYVMEFEPRTDVDNATCRSLIMEELAYTNILREKQKSRFPRVKPRRYLARRHSLSKRSRRRFDVKNFI